MSRHFLSAVFLLVCAAPSFGTGFDEVPCPPFELTATELLHLNARVDEVAGRGLREGDVRACLARGGDSIHASGSTTRVVETGGAEQWYEASCRLASFAMHWSCGITRMRALQVQWARIEGGVTAYLMRDADAALARRRLDQALPMLTGLSAQQACTPDANTATDLANLQGELVVPTFRYESDEPDLGFDISTYNFRIRFQAGANRDAAAHLRCWDKQAPQGFGVYFPPKHR